MPNCRHRKRTSDECMNLKSLCAWALYSVLYSIKRVGFISSMHGIVTTPSYVTTTLKPQIEKFHKWKAWGRVVQEISLRPSSALHMAREGGVVSGQHSNLEMWITVSYGIIEFYMEHGTNMEHGLTVSNMIYKTDC